MSAILAHDGIDDLLAQSWAEIEERHELCRLDPERPILSPTETFFAPDTVRSRLGAYPAYRYSTQSLSEGAGNLNLATRL